MLPGVDAVADDGGLAQRLGGLKPVQALDQHEARSVRAHQDRRLLALREHAVRDRIDALQVERFASRGRHVDIGDWEDLAFQHASPVDPTFMVRSALFVVAGRHVQGVALRHVMVDPQLCILLGQHVGNALHRGQCLVFVIVD